MPIQKSNLNRMYNKNFNNIFENKVIMSDKYHNGHLSWETLVIPLDTLNSHAERLVWVIVNDLVDHTTYYIQSFLIKM